MPHQPSAHLSEEALNDLLIGMSSSESELHLAGCEICRHKVAKFHSDMGVFNQATLAWSREASRKAGPVEVRPTSHRLVFATVSWAVAAVLLVASALPFWHRNNHATGAHASLSQAPITAPITISTGDQIAQDNDLLRAVSAAINPEDASPLNEYHLGIRPRENHRTRSKRGIK
jgi:hypothetical protein